MERILTEMQKRSDGMDVMFVLVPAALLASAFVIKETYSFCRFILEINKEKSDVDFTKGQQRVDEKEKALQEAKSYSEQMSRKQRIAMEAQRRALKDQTLRDQIRKEILAEMQESNLFSQKVLPSSPLTTINFAPLEANIMDNQNSSQGEEKRNIQPTISKKKNISTYLQDVLYREAPIRDEGGIFTCQLLSKEDNGMLTLKESHQKIASAYIDFSQKRLGFIHFHNYGEENRSLVRHYFEKLIHYHLEELMEAEKNGFHSPTNAQETAMAVERTTEQDELIGEITTLHMFIRTLVSTLLEADEELDFEFIHTLHHGFQQDIEKLMETYHALSFEAKRNVHDSMVKKLNRCITYLKNKQQTLEKQSIHQLEGQLRLLEIRTNA